MNISSLKGIFHGFVRTRGLARHFRRLAVLDSIVATKASKDVPPSMAELLLKVSRTEVCHLYREFHTHQDGLTEAQVEDIRSVIGLNEVEHEKPLPWWMHLWFCYKNPFNLLLSLLAVVSYLTEDMKAAIVISSMVVLSTTMRFIQESRSNKAADKLKEMVSNTATVIRHHPADRKSRRDGFALNAIGSRNIELPIRLLVPGDLVRLSAGDMIPADLRIITAKDLFISQAAMTGESIPVEKFAVQHGETKGNPLELNNICFMGTNVVSGSATALVVATGNRTFFGALAERVTSTDRVPTAFHVGVNKVSWLLIRFMLVMAPIVLLVNGFTKGDWLEAALFALSIAVGLTPEMLPMIVTTTLAKGAVIMSRKKVIVKRLDAIQSFGAMDVLCTDKTGTLTQDRIFLERHIGVWGDESEDVLEYAYLNSYYQTGLKNLLDVAVLEHVDIHTGLNVTRNYRKIDEIPFDFQRRRMSVVVSHRGAHHLLICKGAVDEMLALCTHVRHGESVEPLTADVLAHVGQTTATLNQEGLRVVAVAAKKMPTDREVYTVADESELVLIGYIAFLDPPKESTEPALRALKQHGVEVKVLTGDNDLVTAKICREVGLSVNGMLTGADVEGMNDTELTKAAECTTVFAKLTPAHKERIVRVLHQNGHVVGFLGDGINDAPALRAADIGISVDTAVDIAKEAADIILLEKSLMVLEEGVQEGRKTFANMLKYIKMTASSNFGNVFSVLVASVFLPFLPMLPLHLLVQNLLYDVSQLAIPFDNVDAEFLRLPQKWNPDDLGRFMVYFGPVSSIFDISTYALMWFVFHADSAAYQTLFQSGWFVEGLLSQTLIVHMIRSRHFPFLGSRAAGPLLAMTAFIMAVGLLLPMSPIAHYFKLQPLPPTYFLWLFAILSGYVLLTQGMKMFYGRRFGWQ